MQAPSSPHDMPGALYDEASLALGNHAHEILFGLAYAHVRPGERLLDLGIGSGLSSQLFHRAGLGIVGIDSAEWMLESCRAKGIAERLIVHDLASIPWPLEPARYDHAIACGLFHFFEALDPLLREVARVVRPGGTFAFTTMERAAPIPSPIPVFAHSLTHVRERCRAHALEVLGDVAFDTPAGPSREAYVGFRAHLVRVSGTRRPARSPTKTPHPSRGSERSRGSSARAIREPDGTPTTRSEREHEEEHGGPARGPTPTDR